MVQEITPKVSPCPSVTSGQRGSIISLPPLSLQLFKLLLYVCWLHLHTSHARGLRLPASTACAAWCHLHNLLGCPPASSPVYNLSFSKVPLITSSLSPPSLCELSPGRPLGLSSPSQVLGSFLSLPFGSFGPMTSLQREP